MNNHSQLQFDVADVRHRHPIADVVAAEGIDLRPSGRGWMACCPFHDDSTASMSVGGVPDRFHCFGCDASGDVIDFVGRLHGLGFREAVAHLDGTHTERSYRNPGKLGRLATPDTGGDPLPDVAPERAHEVNLLAWQWFSRPVAHQFALAYLRHRRHIDLRPAEQHTRTALAGHTGHGWTPLVDHLRGQGVGDEEMLALDLAQTSRRGTLIDTLRDRLIIPLTSSQGATIGFVGRDTSNRLRAPKYRNPTHTAAFDKSTCLYRPHRSAAADATVVIVEGVLDALAITAVAATSGAFERIVPVSTLGTTVSPVQAGHVIGLSTRPPVIALDGDAAGRQGTLRWVEVLCRHGGQPALVADLPIGADPADWLAHRGAPGLAALHPEAPWPPRPLGQALHQPPPRPPGREIAALACLGSRPVDTAIHDLTRIVHRLNGPERVALVESAVAEMTRQGWNPHDSFAHQLAAALPPDRPAHRQSANALTTAPLL